jgi:hypothetical protein
MSQPWWKRLSPLGISGPTFSRVSRVSGQGKDIYRAPADGSGTDQTAAPGRIHDPFAWRGQQLGYARLVVVPHPVSPDFWVEGMPPERFIDAPLNLFQCVYELRITAFESEAWRKNVVENPSPDIPAYLKAQLNIDV